MGETFPNLGFAGRSAFAMGRRLRRPFGLGRSFRDYARRKRCPALQGTIVPLIRGGSGGGIFRVRAVADPKDSVRRDGGDRVRRKR